MKVLIDANVILDVLLNRSPWVADSRRIWDANRRRRIDGFLVATTITNLFYIARKLVGAELALSGVAKCLDAFEIIPVDRTALMAASALHGADFEDDLVIACAVASGMDFIVTRNPGDFRHSPIPVASPREFIDRTGIVEA